MSEAPVRRDRRLIWVDPQRVIKNDNNPRQAPAFTSDQLATLRASIRVHGILQPIVVSPYDEDMYRLIDGERRLTSAKEEGVKEIPAVVVNRMDDHDELVVMYNIHTQHRGWEMAENLAAIQQLRDRNGHVSDQQMADELGLSLSTYRDRLRVLAMGDDVVKQIATGRLDYSSALRADQTATSLDRNRPDLTTSLGGRTEVARKLLTKVRRNRGISQELVQHRRELAESVGLSDDDVTRYIESPDLRMREVYATRRQTPRPSLPLRKNVTTGHRIAAPTKPTHDRSLREFIDCLQHTTRTMSDFHVMGHDQRDLKQVRSALRKLNDVSQRLELQVVEAISSQETN